MKGIQVLMFETGAEITGLYNRTEHELYNLQVLTPQLQTLERKNSAVSY
jgi:hypothetical protein